MRMQRAHQSFRTLQFSRAPALPTLRSVHIAGPAGPDGDRHGHSARRPEGLDRPYRNAPRHHPPDAGGSARGHARPSCRPGGKRHAAAAAVALALLPAPASAVRDRPRRARPARRLPAAGAAAAAHVGRQPVRVPRADTRRRPGGAHLDHRRRDGQGRTHRPAGLRQGAPRAALQRRRRAGAGRVPRHRLPRGATARRRGAAAAARAGRRRLAARRRRRRRAAVPLLGADLQRPPHPLRPQVRDGGRELPGPRSCTAR